MPNVAKRRPPSSRALDYLYDSAFIVSGARDYAQSAFKAAMGTAQISLQPVYRTMFSDLQTRPRLKKVIYPNCRFPDHYDTSYESYVSRVATSQNIPAPDLAGRDQYKFITIPKKLVPMKTTSPDFHPPSPRISEKPTRPRNRGTQSIFRESSAQTTPWQPDGKPAPTCKNTPEVLYLDKLVWGPGKPYRLGDLPADFHTTEIINKMRHARAWIQVVDMNKFPRWMKSRNDIISDIETKDWIFRQAEIDELQMIRIGLLAKLQEEKRQKASNHTSKILSKIWEAKKKEMAQKVDVIRRTRDREIRKLTLANTTGGRIGLVQRMRASRGGGDHMLQVSDPASGLYAPLARHGWQARNQHIEISYNPDFLLLEDHEALNKPPPWLESCGQNLKKTCSGHDIPRDPMTLCERETKWSEDFLEKLHEDLKKTRLGAAASATAGPLYVLQHRRLQDTPRPKTPEVDPVPDEEEMNHQLVLNLQKIIRGRAVQYLMYEGRTRAAELTEEMKTTHGLQKEDKIRIAKEEAKARDYNVMRTEAEKREDAVTALVDELCGGAVSAALDFLEKELRRLKEERRQHAFIMIALREKQMREAAEAGRRQKEEHRRREHDEMFKQVLGVTQDTVESYLEDIIKEGVEIGAEVEAVRAVERKAEKLDRKLRRNRTMSTAEQNELVAELVQQFLLPSTQKAAARRHIEEMQKGKLLAARRAIFGLLDDAEIKQPVCTICGTPLDEKCPCLVCPVRTAPVATVARDDRRWKLVKGRRVVKTRKIGERYPPAHDFRCMLNVLIDEVVVASRRNAANRELLRQELVGDIKQSVERELEIRSVLQELFDLATGARRKPVRVPEGRHYMKYIREDALERTVPYSTVPCPKELPSEIRRRMEEERAKAGEGATVAPCLCREEEAQEKKKVSKRVVTMAPDSDEEAEPRFLLPSEIRAMEELRKCKCDKSEDDSVDPFAAAIDDILTDLEDWSDDAPEAAAKPPSPKSDIDG